MKNSDYHIAHISSAHYEDDLRIFDREARSLAQKGFQVTYKVQSGQNKKIDNVTIHPLKQGNSRWLRIVRLWDICKEIKKIRPNLVHLHDPELLLLVFFFKMTYKIPILFDDHENIEKDIFLQKNKLPGLFRSIMAFLYRIFQKFIFHWIDGLVIVSESLLNDYKGFPREKIAVVHNFPIFSDRASLHRNPTPGRIIFVGRITPVRGIREMIQAMSVLRHREASLCIIGPVLKHHLDPIVRWVNTTKLTEKVEIIPTTKQETIQNELRKAEIGLSLIYPVEKYMSTLPPTKVFTYMMNRIPVIVSNIPKWEEIINKYRCGTTVNPYDPNNIAAAIDDLLDKPALRQTMGENGYQAVKMYYNWQNEFGRLFALYKKVLFGR